MKKEWLAATEIGDAERVRELLDHGADVNALDRYGQTALMNAAHRGDVALVHLLVQKGADLDHTAKYGLTALMLAVIANRPEVVSDLIKAGANRDIKGSRGQFARTPLEYAEEHGQSELVVLLSNGA